MLRVFRDKGSMNLEMTLIVTFLVLAASVTTLMMGDAIACLYARESATTGGQFTEGCGIEDAIGVSGITVRLNQVVPVPPGEPEPRLDDIVYDGGQPVAVISVKHPDGAVTIHQVRPGETIPGTTVGIGPVAPPSDISEDHSRDVGIIGGKVVDKDGNPVDALITVTAAGYSQSARTTLDGYVSFELTELRTYTVAVEVVGFTSVPQDVDVAEFGRTYPLVFDLTPVGGGGPFVPDATTLRVTVFDDNTGLPVPEATVTATGTSFPVTDAEGQTVSPDLGATGSYPLTVVAVGYTTQTGVAAAAVEGTEQSVVVRLVPVAATGTIRATWAPGTYPITIYVYNAAPIGSLTQPPVGTPAAYQVTLANAAAAPAEFQLPPGRYWVSRRSTFKSSGAVPTLTDVTAGQVTLKAITSAM